MPPPRRTGLAGLQQAFDEVRFGGGRILNLRASLPTGDEAARRAEAWLRQHQVLGSGEVLVITGRGKGSADGISVVREAVIRTFHQLKRKNVVAGFEEHTAGSFVVALAPVRQLVDAPARARGASAPPPPPTPASLEALAADTRDRLRDLARCTLDFLGVRDPSPQMVEDEMLRHFAALAAGVGTTGRERERALRVAIERAIEECQDA